VPVPDITGQPPWVVIILAALGLAGTIGVAWLASRNRKSATRDDDGQATMAPSQDLLGMLQKAMDHLAATAERESAESDQAREEAASMRRELEQTKMELASALHRAQSAEAQLTACREHATALIQQVQRGPHA
jgi:uncharacterized protein (DUF3084 family)